MPPVEKANAITAMRDALLRQPAGHAWLVATGALTNIALLFGTFPEIAEHIAGLSIMGGSLGGGFNDAPLGRFRGEKERVGNFTPWAEFNIYVSAVGRANRNRARPSIDRRQCDPESAKSVFSNPAVAPKMTLIPLDITHLVLATKPVQEKLLYGSLNPEEKETSDVRRMFHDLLIFFAQTYADVGGIPEGPPLHDPLAVAVVLFDIGAERLDFNYADGERFNIDVVTDGMHSNREEVRGQVGRTSIRGPNGPKIRIPRGLDVGAFWSIIEECLQRVDKLLASQS